MTNEQKISVSIYSATIVSILIASFWGLFMFAPPIVKGVMAIGMWTSVLFVPVALYRKNDFSRRANLVLRALLILGVYEILVSVFNTDASMYALGNKWITLFGNEYTALILMPPLFTYIGSSLYGVKKLKKATCLFLVCGALFSLALKYPLAFLTTFVIVFYPYVGKKYKCLIGLVFVEAIIKATMGDNPTRMFLIIIPFSIIVILFLYVIKSERIKKWFVVAVTVAPLILFVPMLMANNGEESFFQKANLYIVEKTDDDGLASDTRTFLYLEMAEDLTHTNSWLLGKGAFSHYYSLYFDQSSNGKYGRISSEVPLLNYLLRGGLIYVLLYFGLILIGAYNAIFNGKNKFVQSIGIMALCWYFNSFVGDIIGCRFYHVAFFILLGCTLSPKLLNMSDQKIKRILMN
ncbi:MAG: hypothetical protein Q4E63_03850 [Prevotellaceae bacterium]|nr:hypothetical protein [Prevotellaceae bacterium]